MREIKFRGRRLDPGYPILDGLWVYGHYFTTPLTEENSGCKPEDGWFFLSDGVTRHCIAQDNNTYVVDPATVGQYTGLKDKNGVEIYEHDLCEGGTLRCQDGFTILNEKVSRVHFAEGLFMVGSISLCSINRNTVVVGNIYENPELIGGNQPCK